MTISKKTSAAPYKHSNTVEWDNGAIDIAPETAYENAVPLK